MALRNASVERTFFVAAFVERDDDDAGDRNVAHEVDDANDGTLTPKGLLKLFVLDLLVDREER